MKVCNLEVRPCLADSAISSRGFTSLELGWRAVQAHREHVVSTEQADQAVHPLASLNDVFYEQVVACFRDCRNASMKPLKEGVSKPRPGKFAAIDPPLGEHFRSNQIVD
ncbi:MAG TPA: hypothetical protein VMK32_00170 [Burkholderiaceae bacterium]|nr:hypothetical protein [Burkholderiaceae bacterium]